jgi:ADP-ribosylglycohydrolase
MLGAVLGDLLGSQFEGGRCQDPKAQLLSDGCQFTDDTVLTIAVAQALIEGCDIATSLRTWTRRYPNRGYGGSFLEWATSEKNRPYRSFSNGGAMRVSPVALIAQTLPETLELATWSAAPTHGHEDGLRGAQAIAAAIFLARTGENTPDIRQYLTTTFGYDLRGTVSQRAKVFGFSTLAEDTVPDALTSALDATSFEHAIRNALWIGGDSDTIACMAGGIAEVRFGITAGYREFLETRLPPEMVVVLQALYAKAQLPFPLPATTSAGGAETPSPVARLLSGLLAFFKQ